MSTKKCTRNATMAGWKPEIKAGMPEKAGEEHDGSRIGVVFTN
jgi:hypothetical protein